MKPHLYTLDGRTPVPCDDCLIWGEWFKSADRHVAKDSVHGILVSTVFLGIDHDFWDSEPILFETMLFTEITSLPFQTRYATWEEAAVGHQMAIEYLKASLPAPAACDS